MAVAPARSKAALCDGSMLRGWPPLHVLTFFKSSARHDGSNMSPVIRGELLDVFSRSARSALRERQRRAMLIEAGSARFRAAELGVGIPARSVVTLRA